MEPIRVKESNPEEPGGLAQVGVYNKAGDLVYHQRSGIPIHAVTDITALNSLPSGEYYVIIQDSSNVITEKLVVK
ncbi:MAG: hypothetical protein U0T82_15825 [Bacteroidales bacterium]